MGFSQGVSLSLGLIGDRAKLTNFRGDKPKKWLDGAAFHGHYAVLQVS
jgi:hypothetical protein